MNNSRSTVKSVPQLPPGQAGQSPAKGPKFIFQKGPTTGGSYYYFSWFLIL